MPFYHRRFLVSLLVDYADQLSPPAPSILYCGPPAVYTRPNSNPERIARILSYRKFESRFLSREIITKNMVE